MRKILLTLLCFFYGFCEVSLALDEGTSIDSTNEYLNAAFKVYGEAQAATQREIRMDKFRRAQHLFSNVESEVEPNAPLWTNIGTAALQAEDLGYAILAYRKALLINPNYDQARQNLIHARALLPSTVPTPGDDGVLDSFFSWHSSMKVDSQAGLAALFFVLAALGFAFAIHWRSGMIRNLSFFPLLLWGGLLISVLIQLTGGNRPQGVLVANESIARAADSVNSPMRFSQPLPAGTEVEILDVRDPWAKISMANGRDAWIFASSYELVE